MGNWFKPSIATLRRWVKDIQEKRAAKEYEILIMMQISGSFHDTLRDIEEIFRRNPLLKLHRYKPFRAWYKYHMTYIFKDPEFYAKMIENGMTPFDEDPYFDPNAPDWEQFERHNDWDEDEDYFFDEDEDGDEDDDSSDDFGGGQTDLKKAARDGFGMGVGFGIVNSIVNG